MFSIPFVLIGCGAFDENSPPEIEPINDITLEVGDETTVEVNITDTDVYDTHDIKFSSDNTRIAKVWGTVSEGVIVGLEIEGVAAGITTIIVTAIDDSGQDNATSLPVAFLVTVNEPPPGLDGTGVYEPRGDVPGSDGAGIYEPRGDVPNVLECLFLGWCD